MEDKICRSLKFLTTNLKSKIRSKNKCNTVIKINLLLEEMTILPNIIVNQDSMVGAG